ncbi:MAG: hypothetical protein ACJ790_20080 [Myxococcaceae bacterium]
MNPRVVLASLAAGVLIASLVIYGHDRMELSRAVSCLHEKFGESAPTTDSPECHTQFTKFGFVITNGWMMDTAGPFGAFQAGAGLCWATGFAALVVLISLAFKGKRTKAQIIWGSATLFVLIGWLIAYYSALQIASAQDVEGWRKAEAILKAIVPIVGLAAILATGFTTATFKAAQGPKPDKHLPPSP